MRDTGRDTWACRLVGGSQGPHKAHYSETGAGCQCASPGFAAHITVGSDMHSFAAAGAAFLLAVLWFDLMFDVQTRNCACRQRFCAHHHAHGSKCCKARERQGYGGAAIDTGARDLSGSSIQLCAHDCRTWLAADGAIRAAAARAHLLRTKHECSSHRDTAPDGGRCS